MGEWLRQLLCLVPIQIARAENNGLTPLADGLELSANAHYVDSVSLANVIRFGLYEAVLATWHGPMKIISSMGKQSSGKSFVLNHLSGSVLDVSGGRCTDGVWMTVRISQGFLYVLLDFEGLGTLERSEQEDMLLAVLNAAVSDITIYSKKEFNLDKETENVFRRFQNGVALVKEDQKLFSGMFYMAIKDVGTADVYELQEEFERKIKKMIGCSTDNFLTRMYGGEVEVATMAAFDTPDYYRSIGDVRNTIDLLRASYNDGDSFSTDLKLILAQLSAKDWAPLDSKRMALRLSLMQTHLSSAVSMGCLKCKGREVNYLVNFDSQEEIPDHPILLDSVQFSVSDAGLSLQPCARGDGDSSGDILMQLKLLFEDMVPRSGSDDESWFAKLGSFIDSLVDRRKSRVLEWISSNFQKFHQQDETQIIRLEAAALCAELKQKLALCGAKCEKCFFKCTREKGQSPSHSCLAIGDHLCSQNCTYCEKEHVYSPGSIDSCHDVAGHSGLHNCKGQSHTCKEICVYHGVASNCNRICAGVVGHVGEHLCNSRQHMCAHTCSLESCNNSCTSPFEVKDHFPHACHEKFCPRQCNMSGCNRVCASQDHFHDAALNVSCGHPHPCPERCEARGNCAVQQDLVRTTKTFRGKYGSFEYEHVAEQNGIRRNCCIDIPPFQTTHEGPHSHSLNESVVHLCDKRCHSCGYFCMEPIGHAGVHNTVHGNMRGVTFTAETEKIEMEDRTYAWGESEAAEMCQMYCKSQGRGHVHLIECPSARSEQDQAGVCYSKLYQEGVRHETRKYGPHPEVPKDEMTHAAYWRHMRFADPCSKEDQTLFGLCGHECTSQEHRIDASASKELRRSKKSFCTLKLWHQRVSTSGNMLHDQGYITLDGHQMDCSHLRLSNVVFVIDRSSSMGLKDMTPTLVQFQGTHNNRLGCVYEAILRFVRTRLSMQQGQVTDLVSVVLFNHSAVSAVEPSDMNESFLTDLLSYLPKRGTVFSNGLQEAEKILLGSQQKAFAIGKVPVVIFVSGGENDGGDTEAALSCITTMKFRLPQLVLHTVIFGSRHGATELMKKMAKEGNGEFNVSIDGLELSRKFMYLSRSLKPRVAALI